MSDAVSAIKTAQPLNPEEILGWLRDNPDFLNDHPEVLDLLLPPQEKRGQTIVDFQHYMMRRLRADRDDILQSAREVVETSRANMNNQTRIHTAILMMMDAQDFDDFLHVLTGGLAPHLGVDIVSLVVEAEGDSIPQIDIPGVRAIRPGGADLLLKNRAVALESNISGHEAVYGGGASLVKSQALLRLDLMENGPQALIAFGSRDPHMFQDGQATDLLMFLGQMTARCLAAWLR